MEEGFGRVSQAPPPLSPFTSALTHTFQDANISGGAETSGGNENLEELQKKFFEHTAQWKLNKRGIDGETVIHLLLSRDDAKCSEIAKLLIKLYPGLAIDIYEGDEFYGQSPLHLAIVHDDYDMMTVLLDSGADIKCRATGRFFLPEDQKRARKAKQTNYYGRLLISPHQGLIRAY